MEKIAHQLTKNVKILQKAVLVADGKVLLLKRTEDALSRPGCWDLPGGNVEWPESFESQNNPHRDELLREVSEETGLDYSGVMGNKPCFASTYFDSDTDIYTVILGWKIAVDHFEPTISEEHTDFAWVALDELEDYDFGFAGGPDGFLTQMITNGLQFSA